MSNLAILSLKHRQLIVISYWTCIFSDPQLHFIQGSIVPPLAVMPAQWYYYVSKVIHKLNTFWLIYKGGENLHSIKIVNTVFSSIILWWKQIPVSLFHRHMIGYETWIGICFSLDRIIEVNIYTIYWNTIFIPFVYVFL